MTFHDCLTENETKPEAVDVLHALAQEGPYWESAYNFYLEEQDTVIIKMTQKQREWATKICEDVIERVITQRR